MKNNIVIGVAVVVVLIVVLGFVLGNQGENYSIFPEYATPAGVQGVDWEYAATPAGEEARMAAAMAAASPPDGRVALQPLMAGRVAKAINPPATINSCKALLKVATDPVLSSPAMANAGARYDKNTRDLAKGWLASPDLALIAGATVTVNPRKLKNMMAAAVREAYDAGTLTGFAMTAKAGALVTKQQMNQLKVKAGKTRDRDLMSFAERADKLADTLSDISAKLVSRSKPVCYVNQMGNKYPLYNTIEDPNTPFGPFIRASTKILSDMNNGGGPFFFAKDMEELRNILESKKC